MLKPARPLHFSNLYELAQSLKGRKKGCVMMPEQYAGNHHQSVSYLLFKTNPLVSILFTLAANLSNNFFFIKKCSKMFNRNRFYFFNI